MIEAIALDPQPSVPGFVKRLVRVPDVFHDDAFAGTPAEGHGAKGERRLVWYCEDFAGNLVGEWAGGLPTCPHGEPCTVEDDGGVWKWVRS